jgi:hypothetical protein
MISETHNRRVEPNPSRDACPVRTIVRYFWRSVGTTDARWRNPFCPRPQLAREPQRSPISRGYSGSACTECAPRRLPRNPPTRRELATCLGEARRRSQECGRELPLYLRGSCRHFDDACVEAGLSVGHGGPGGPGTLPSQVVWAGESHPRPNPKPDVQVSKYPAFQMFPLNDFWQSCPDGMPDTGSGCWSGHRPAESWQSALRVRCGRPGSSHKSHGHRTFYNGSRRERGLELWCPCDLGVDFP